MYEKRLSLFPLDEPCLSILSSPPLVAASHLPHRHGRLAPTRCAESQARSTPYRTSVIKSYSPAVSLFGVSLISIRLARLRGRPRRRRAGLVTKGIALHARAAAPASRGSARLTLPLVDRVADPLFPRQYRWSGGDEPGAAAKHSRAHTQNVPEAVGVPDAAREAERVASRL